MLKSEKIQEHFILKLNICCTNLICHGMTLLIIMYNLLIEFFYFIDPSMDRDWTEYVRVLSEYYPSTVRVLSEYGQRYGQRLNAA